MKFAQMLKELRQEKGLTQMQLAVKLNVTDGAVKGWENRDREPSYAILCEIANTLEVTVGQLLGVEDY